MTQNIVRTSSPELVSRRTTVIEPSSGWRVVDWRALVEYRDLLYFLVRRDVKALYAQTVLGLSWAVIRPVFSMIVFTIVFGGLASVPSDGAPYALFSFAALVPWTYFSTAMSGATDSLISSSSLVTKVYFPRMIIPFTPIAAGLVDLMIALAVLGILMMAFGVAPTWGILLIPVLIALMVLSAAGIGLWLSSMAVQYRDVKHGVTFLGQLLMYAAPVVWPVSLIEQKFPVYGEVITRVYAVYPMVGVIEGFRAALLGTRSMPWDLIGIGAIGAGTLFLTGAFYFRRMERVFADVA